MPHTEGLKLSSLYILPPPCCICGAVSSGYHFGVIACKACAAFFRRSVSDNRGYDCQQQNNCPINDEDRTICRSCRLKKCYECGMMAEKVQKRKHKFASASSTTSRSDSCGTCLSSESFTDSESPVIRKNKRISNDSYKNRKRASASAVDKIIDGLKSYWNSQKAAYYSRYPELKGEDHEFKPSTIVTHVQSQMALLPLMHRMCVEHFDGFDELSETQQLTIIEKNETLFSPFEVAYNTSKYFPSLEETRILYAYDDMVDIVNYEAFFKDDKHSKESSKLYLPYAQAMLKFVKKYKQLKVTKFELAAMAGLLLWGEVKTTYALDIAYKMDDIITKELTEYCRKEYGENNFRFGQLLLLRRDAEIIGAKLNENYIISSIENKHYADYNKLRHSFYNMKLEETS